MMTDREKDIFEFIISFIGKYGYSPSIREITKGVYLASTYSVQRHLVNLSDKGFLKHTPKTPRSIVVLSKPA